MRYPVNCINIRQGFSSLHHGIDLGWDSSIGKHQSIYAIANGIVVYNRKQVTGGYVIGIYHPDLDVTSEYGHLLKDSQTIKEGEKVVEGQMIAKMGASGMVTGIHLHFGIQKGRGLKYKNVKWLNPIEYLIRYKNQAISTHSKDKLKILHTNIAHGITSEPLLVHNKKNFLKSSVVKNYNIYNGEEVPVYEIEGSYALIDKIRKYYTASKYIK